MAKHLGLLFLVAMAAMLGLVAPSSAQSARSFVSATNGADSNPCSVTSPCRTINAAIAATATGGEVYCLSSGGYGSVSITKAISIVCDRVDAALSAASGAVVTVNAPGARVFLEGLHITGLGTATAGIAITAADGVAIEQCVISNVEGSGGAGVAVSGNTLTVALHNSIVNANANGISLDATSSSTEPGMTIEDSVVNRNDGSAILINGATVGVGVAVNRSQIGGDGTAVTASGPAGVLITASLVTHNFGGFQTSGGAVVVSSGNNQFSNNGTTNQNNYSNGGLQ